MVKVKNENFEQNEVHLRASLQDRTKRVIALRSKDREFHGVEREFLAAQADMLAAYERTKDIKHPRDLGDAREHILRNFLLTGGYLPKRFAVSERSVRVVSTTGHISNEIDIALYDPIDTITLMKRQDVYEVYPIESVYGVIQVKSLLTKKELRSGLKNLASFKKLDRPLAQKPFSTIIGPRTPQKSERGFSILFSYCSDMSWQDIITELETFSKSNPKKLWSNAVFILDRGFFLFGDKSRACYFNEAIESISELQMHGYPDRENLNIFQFQNLLLELLDGTSIAAPKLAPYFQLPLIAEGHSYHFTFGKFVEIGHCDQHGDFARKLSPEALEKLVAWCASTTPINWIQALDIAYDLPQNDEAYRRQPSTVRIYNPENLPLSDVLLVDGILDGKPCRSLGYDSIETEGMTILIPYYYTAKEALISGCPKCGKPTKPRQTATKGTTSKVSKKNAGTKS